MSTWKVILATLVIFGAGVITGGLLVSQSYRAAHHLLRRAPPDRPLPPPRPPGSHEPGPNAREMGVPPALRQELLNRLNRELNLSREQSEQIENIVRQGQDHTRELWRLEVTATRQKIRAALTPEQQARFQELLKQRPANQRNPDARDRTSANSPQTAVSSNTPAAE